MEAVLGAYCLLFFWYASKRISPANTKNTAKGKIPVGVGFGISTEKDVQKYVSSGADAVIVGSANIKIMENTPTNKIQSKIATFTKKLKNKTR